MPSNDPFLHAGLTPSTDVKLYESAATGGGTNTPVSASTTATGVAAVSRVLTLGRTFTVTSTGVATASRVLTLARAFTTTATGQPAATRQLALNRALSTTVTGVATESHVFTAAAGQTFTRLFEVTATGVATESHTFISGTPEPEPIVGGSSGGTRRRPPRTLIPRPVPRPVPRTHSIRVAVVVNARVRVTFTVDHAGRRLLEDELVLAGAF